MNNFQLHCLWFQKALNGIKKKSECLSIKNIFWPIKFLIVNSIFYIYILYFFFLNYKFWNFFDKWHSRILSSGVYLSFFFFLLMLLTVTIGTTLYKVALHFKQNFDFALLHLLVFSWMRTKLKDAYHVAS